MIEPLPKERIILVSEPLPPCWIRRHKTVPDTDTAAGAVLRVGPDGLLHRSLIESIEQAAEVIFVASFLFSDEGVAAALLRAAKRKRRVYVLTASEEKLSKLVPDEDIFEARMVDEHKRLLNRLAGKVVLRSAEHFHAKLLVTDPETNPRGWITTANFNKALRESVELGVRLSAKAASAVADWFSYAFWLEAQHELTSKGRLARVRKPPAVPRAPAEGVIVATTKQHTLLQAEILRLIEGARGELLVASYGLHAAHPVVEAIAAKAEQGVKVTVFTRPRPAVRDAALRLATAGAQVIAHDKLHAKAIVSDAGAMVMSANLEPNGLDTGFEVGVVLDQPGRQELRHILAHDWTERFPWRFETSLDRRDHLGEICLADHGLRDGCRDVIEEKSITLPTVEARDALHLDSVPEPKLRAPEMSEYPRRLRFEWVIQPPHLPEGAKEQLRAIEREEKTKGGKVKKVKARVSHDPPVFKHRGKTFVVLRSEDEMARVRAVAGELDARVVLS